MGISHQQAVRLPDGSEIAIGINESSRDRSSSAPNIYEITKDETLRETVNLRISEFCRRLFCSEKMPSNT